MKKSALVEYLVLMVLFVAVNLIWSPGDIGFVQARPHPYLVIILVLAVRHGVLAALVAVALSCCMVFGLSRLGNYALLPQDALARPWNFIIAQWIVLGATVGAAADAKERDMKKLEQKLEYLHNDFDENKKRLELSEAENLELRKQVFGEGETLSTVYEMARRLITLRGEDLFRASLELVHKFVGATQCSVYLLSTDRLSFLLQHTLGLGHFEPPKKLNRGNPLLEKALRDEKVTTVKDLFSAQKDRQQFEAVLVAPIGGVAEGSGECGVLVVHRLPMERLNSQTIGIFKLLADWISRALNLVQRFEAAEDPNSEFMEQIKKRRFTTSFIQTLSKVTAIENRAFEILCEEDLSEIAYWNASKMLVPSSMESTRIGTEESLLKALDIVLSNGSHLGAVLTSLPIQSDLPGCSGLRIRIQERAELNAQAAVRVLRTYITQYQASCLPDIYALDREMTPSRRQYHMDTLLSKVEFFSTRKESLAFCLGLNRPDPLKVTNRDLLLSLTHDSDRWTKRLAVLASHELGFEVDIEVLDILAHSDSPVDVELASALAP